MLTEIVETTETIETAETSVAVQEPRALDSAVGVIAASIKQGLSPGDLSALRRVGRRNWGVPAYWRVVNNVLVPRGLVVSERDEAHWAVVLSALALLGGQHEYGMSFGRALAVARVSDSRVERLLRAHGDALLDLVRPLAHQLASSGVRFNQVILADLIISDGTVREDKVRRSIARDFYWTKSATDKAEK